ncbi:hypothetical protein ACFL5V_09745 [Fibrobacterota bacterium]
MIFQDTAEFSFYISVGEEFEILIRMNESDYCPACGSTKIEILDKGAKLFMRGILLNNRWYCRECHATWRKRTPYEFHYLTMRSLKTPG